MKRYLFILIFIALAFDIVAQELTVRAPGLGSIVGL